MARQETDPGLDAGDAFAGEALAIETTYHRMLDGLGYLPKRDQAGARLAAHAIRLAALKALRDRQGSLRRARRLSRQAQGPPAP